MNKVKILLTSLILILCSVGNLFAAIDVTEEQINKHIRIFDHQSLETIIANNSDNDLESASDYYLIARAYEGLLRYYETQNDTRKTTKISNKGVKLLKKAINMENNHSDAHRLLSRFYAKLLTWNNGYTIGPKIVEELDLALKYNPDNPRAIMGKIAIYLYAPPLFGGNVDLALDKLIEFTNKHPDFEDGFINLAIAYKFKGNNKKSKEIFVTILKNNPHNLTAQKEVKELMKRYSDSAWDEL